MGSQRKFKQHQPSQQQQTQQKPQAVIIDHPAKKVRITPRNKSQSILLANLMDYGTPINLVLGPAGTGKTFISTQFAIQQLQEKSIEKIIITRPNVAIDDRDIGFLPGDVNDKMWIWCIPILDVFRKYFTLDEIKWMINNDILELCPLAHTRGRTFESACVILDEAQSTTPSSMKAFLTRIGQGSTMIITGDIEQTDIKGANGLQDLLDRMKQGVPEHLSLTKFAKRDIVRHKAIGEVLKLYQTK